MEPNHAVRTPPVVDLHNGVVSVDAAMPLVTLGRWCRVRGLHLPLARPLPGLTLAEACVRLPAFADACVASVEGVAEGGQPVETPRAPPAALGPDFCASLMLPQPLFVPHRLRLRICDATHCRVTREVFAGAQDLLASFRQSMEAGRTFFLEGVRVGAHHQLLRIEGIELPPRGVELPEFAHEARFRVRSGASLWPGDVASWEQALSRGDRVWAAPFQGRIGFLSALRPSRADTPTPGLDLEGACHALAHHLERRETGRGS